VNGFEDDACRDTDAPAELQAETVSSQGGAVDDLRLVVALEADDAPPKPPRGASKTATQTRMFKSEKTDLRKNVGAANKVRAPACFPAFFFPLRVAPLEYTPVHACMTMPRSPSLARATPGCGVGFQRALQCDTGPWCDTMSCGLPVA